MSDSFCIEKASENEPRILSKLIRSSFADVAERFHLTPENCPKHPSNCTQKWIDADVKRGVSYFILKNKDIVIGCVGVERADNHTCYMERLAVLPEYRKKGFGKKLALHAIRLSKQLGVNHVGIGIIAGDTGLRNWYEKMGFKQKKTLAFDHLPFDVMLMSLNLSAD